ncbi:competence protein CoiA family protein [Actinoplanes sp. TFC3]|uniref:competence protein CoiA family protein n=1 Tax=Actinoplanes sp. TFC3 TaxID=1710355 RepID=UPI000832F3E8|nr:competence protein CoiA family protein [Actinoplanes sp. TFC3]
MGDLSVVGFDTRTGRSVHVDDAPKHVWNQHGYGGTAPLVCWHCFHGDEAPPGTLVPLQCRGGRKYGKVRTHFAHPPGMAPAGGHHPETLWHANAKQTLLRWARQQPGVADAVTEYRTADGRRRTDVEVSLTDGTRLALKVQQQPLTDEAWTRRHQDYTAAGLTDIWLWHSRLGVPGIARDEPQCHWRLAADLNAIGVPLARPHGFDGAWWMRPDHRVRALHYPPCAGDPTEVRWTALADFTAGPTGLLLPATFIAELRDATAAVARKADRIRQRHSAPPTPKRPALQGGRVNFGRVNPPAVHDLRVHEVHRIDALPPNADPELRRYRCQVCNWVTGDVLNDGIHKLVECR